MRLLKEIFFLVLVAFVGVIAVGWCTETFGAKASGELLKFGGLVASGLLLVAQRLNAATAAADQLADFDEVTRRDYESGVATFRRRFKKRLICGIVLAAFAAAIGIIIGEWETTDREAQVLLSCVGGGMLAASAVMMAAQLLASSWPAEFLAETQKIARADRARVANVERYSVSTEHVVE